jgi:putative spermidine/putrescine transport system substrate-binding protein
VNEFTIEVKLLREQEQRCGACRPHGAIRGDRKFYAEGKMKMLMRKIGSCVVLAAGLCLSSPTLARDLTLVSWGGAVQKAQSVTFFKPFSEISKTPLQELSWEGGVGILRAKVQSGQADWDIIQVESSELAIGCEENLYEKLDWTKIGGKDLYDAGAVSNCGVGALEYSLVLRYDPAKLPDAPKSWVDFFDLKKYPGKRALRSVPQTTLEIALLADGVAPADVHKVLGTTAGVDRAFKKLDTIKPSLIWWQTGQKPVDLLVSGEVAMTAVYNGRITAANKAGKNLKNIWNQSLYTWDSWVILKGSPSMASAYKLLEFMGSATRQAEQLKILANGTSNKQAISLVDRETAAALPSEPDNAAQAIEINADFWLENLDKLNDRFTKWAAQ